jgi:hypothetical protein
VFIGFVKISAYRVNFIALVCLAVDVHKIIGLGYANLNAIRLFNRFCFDSHNLSKIGAEPKPCPV